MRVVNTNHTPDLFLQSPSPFMLQKLADSNLSWPIINIHPMLKLLCFHTFIDWYMTHDYQIYLYVRLVKINIWQYGLRFSYLSPHFIIFNADEQKFLKISLNSLKYIWIISEKLLTTILCLWTSSEHISAILLNCLKNLNCSEFVWKIWTALKIAETVWTLSV